MKDDIEDIIIGKIKDGDMQACKYIVDKYKSFVFNIAFRVVRNREDAEEIAQDSFIKAIKSIADFKYESKFSTWLYRITFNNSISRLRKRKLFTEEINELMKDMHPLSTVESGFEKLNQLDRSQILKNAMEFLSDEEKLLLTLYYYEENSMAEVAQITGLVENLVKVKVHRARKKLYDKLSYLMGIKVEDLL